jgi:class 3 adenylate cyclase
MGDASSIDAVAAAVGEESLDFGGMSSPDGAITLLFSDIDHPAGGEAPPGEDAPGELLRQLVERHDGEVVKARDSARMCSFASAHAGLHCAIELQKAAAGQLRIGLHSGFVMADASDFYGRNVVLAARIAEHAGAGEILVSRAVREYTATDPTFEFEPRGDQHFKGLLGEHAVFAVSWS